MERPWAAASATPSVRGARSALHHARYAVAPHATATPGQTQQSDADVVIKKRQHGPAHAPPGSRKLVVYRMPLLETEPITGLILWVGTGSLHFHVWRHASTPCRTRSTGATLIFRQPIKPYGMFSTECEAAAHL